MTVSEMGARMSFPEFLSWVAFYRHEADSHKASSHTERAEVLAHQAIRAQHGGRF